MSAKDTVSVNLSAEQAATTACWLATYTPKPSPYRMSADWENDQRQLAAELGGILTKAAKRKRTSPVLKLAIFRDLACWFAAFTSPDGWWDFGGVPLPGQPAPESIQQVAKLFLRAVSSRKGRPLLTILETEERLESTAKAVEIGEADERVLRRLRAGKRGLEWEMNEIEAAGPEPEA